MNRAIRGLCILCVLAAWNTPVLADPLDRVSGTESWKTAGPQSIEREWSDWYRARVLWRKARQEWRIQRRRNHQLALLLRHGRRGRIDLGQARNIIRSRPVRRVAVEDHSDADAMLQQGRSRQRPVKVYNPTPQPRGRGRSDTPEPPSWVKVPVERLDNSGQAIDNEGDRILEDSTKQNKK